MIIPQISLFDGCEPPNLDFDKGEFNWVGDDKKAMSFAIQFGAGRFGRRVGWLWKHGGYDFYISVSGNGLGLYCHEGRSGCLVCQSFSDETLQKEVCRMVNHPNFAGAIERAIKNTGLSPMYKEKKVSE